jgi:hypothetical protein
MPRCASTAARSSQLGEIRQTLPDMPPLTYASRTITQSAQNFGGLCADQAEGGKPMSRSPWLTTLVLLGVACPLSAADLACVPVHTHERAGCPEHVACWARPSDSSHHVGYAVGGNKHLHGNLPSSADGTWGWDYAVCFPRRITVLWSHGRCECSAPGTYRTDGPRCVMPHP